MSWSLGETLLWPLEQLIRQYVGFNESVIKEYNNLIEYGDCLRYKPLYAQWIIAQWREVLIDVADYPYIYQFRFIFNNDDYNDEHWLIERISEPPCFYKDIVKIGFAVGRVI